MKGERPSTQTKYMSETEIKLPEGMTADEAVDVLQEYGTTEEPKIVETTKLDSLKSTIEEVKEVFATALAEESPQSADTLAKQDIEALTEPYRNEEGEIEVDTLRQEPETGDVGSDEEETETSDGFDVDSLSHDDVEKLDLLAQKRTAFKSRDVPGRVEALEEEMAEIAGVEEFDEIEMEAL